MNINQLAIFHAVAEEGSVTRAAERLHISQPAVSKQLRELERSLGMALFYRLSKGVRLTDAGELLAGFAKQIFDLESEAERALNELRRLERGRLRVGASTTIGDYLLTPTCALFKSKYPGIEMSLEIANTDVIQKRLIANELDLALTEGLEETGLLKPEIIMTDEIVAIVAPSHPLAVTEPVSIAALCEFPMVQREAGSGTRAVVQQALQERGLQPPVALSLGSSEAIKRTVAAGTGWAFMSRLAIEDEIERGILHIVPLLDLAIERPLHRLRMLGKHESRAVREFLRLLREYIAERYPEDPNAKIKRTLLIQSVRLVG